MPELKLGLIRMEISQNRAYVNKYLLKNAKLEDKNLASYEIKDKKYNFPRLGQLGLG